MVNVILSWHYICKYCLALGELCNCDKKFNADGVVDISVATECVNTITANELLARHKFLLANLLVTFFRLQNC